MTHLPAMLFGYLLYTLDDLLVIFDQAVGRHGFACFMSRARGEGIFAGKAGEEATT